MIGNFGSGNATSNTLSKEKFIVASPRVGLRGTLIILHFRRDRTTCILSTVKREENKQ